jgi:hypothetical protein
MPIRETYILAGRKKIPAHVASCPNPSCSWQTGYALQDKTKDLQSSFDLAKDKLRIHMMTTHGARDAFAESHGTGSR